MKTLRIKENYHKNGRKKSGRNKTQFTEYNQLTSTPLRVAASDGSGTPEDFGRDVFKRALGSWYGDGMDELDLARHYAMIRLIRNELIFQKIEAAFADQPLLKSIPPDAADNHKQLDAYLNYFAKATEGLNSAVAIVKSLQLPEIWSEG